MKARFAALVLALASVAPALTVASALVACSCSVSCRVIDPSIQTDKIQTGMELICNRVQSFAAADPELEEDAKALLIDKATRLYMLTSTQETTNPDQLLQAGWKLVRKYHDEQVQAAPLEPIEKAIYLDNSASVQSAIDAAMGKAEAP